MKKIIQFVALTLCGFVLVSCNSTNNVELNKAENLPFVTDEGCGNHTDGGEVCSKTSINDFKIIEIDDDLAELIELKMNDLPAYVINNLQDYKLLVTDIQIESTRFLDINRAHHFPTYISFVNGNELLETYLLSPGESILLDVSLDDATSEEFQYMMLSTSAILLRREYAENQDIQLRYQTNFNSSVGANAFVYFDIDRSR